MRHCSYSVKSSDSTGDHREGTIENAKMYYCSWISGFEMQQNTIRSKPHYSNAPICVYSVCFCVEYEGFSMRCYCLSLLPATHQHCCKCALVECGFSQSCPFLRINDKLASKKMFPLFLKTMQTKHLYFGLIFSSSSNMNNILNL